VYVRPTSFNISWQLPAYDGDSALLNYTVSVFDAQGNFLHAKST
jgi:hypothetical protein